MSDSWEITVVYDSNALPGFESGWGFSALLSSADHRILFDCGWDGHLLRNNLGRLGRSFADIDTVFLSHSHWDHISGLPEILHDALVPGSLEVVVPRGFSERLKREISVRARLRETDGAEELISNVFTTGSLGKDVAEQSLVLRCGEAVAVITGCAHPGLPEILARAREIGRPTMLIGGFHDAEPEAFPEEAERVLLCHCTRRSEEIVRHLGGRAEIGAVGRAVRTL